MKMNALTTRVSALALVFLILSGSLVLPSYEEIDYLIEEMEHGMWIHEQWADYVELHPELAETMGDAEWHMHWVDTYNRTIIVLRSYRQLLSALRMLGRPITIGRQ